jgi:hypothetical protein
MPKGIFLGDDIIDIIKKVLDMTDIPFYSVQNLMVFFVMISIAIFANTI